MSYADDIGVPRRREGPHDVPLSDATASALPQPDDDMIERAASELVALIDAYAPNLYHQDWWQCNAERYREKARRILTAALRPTPADQAGES